MGEEVFRTQTYKIKMFAYLLYWPKIKERMYVKLLVFGTLVLLYSFETTE